MNQALSNKNGEMVLLDVDFDPQLKSSLMLVQEQSESFKPGQKNRNFTTRNITDNSSFVLPNGEKNSTLLH